MRFGSVCSGIEAASVAFEPLGWKAAWLAEIEAFPSAVLAHHYPATPNFGDMTQLADRIDAQEIEAPDMLCGGCPCQSFSVAGLRKSLGDQRGNLTLEFIRIADAIDRIRRHHGKPPAWVLYENVPGILSTKDNAFGSFLGGLCGGDSALDAPADGWPSAGVVAGPGRVVAWRVLDAQYFGLAQRRKRVFVLALGGPGGWACADALLPIGDSMQRHPAPRRGSREEVTAGTLRSTDGGVDLDHALARHIVGTLTANGKAAGSATQQDAQNGMLVTHALTGEGFDASEDGTGRGTPLVPVLGFDSRQDPVSSKHIFGALGSASPQAQAVAYSTKLHNTASNQAGKIYENYTVGLDANSPPPALLTLSQVRRLTPGECEALMGFPRGYTAIPFRGKPAADGPRYKALGNSWAVPCISWIGRRIEMVRAIDTRVAA